MDVLLSIAKEIKVGQKGVLNDILPFEGGAWWSEGLGCCIVLIESHSNSSGSLLESAGDVLAESVA